MLIGCSTTLKGTRADWLVEKGAELGAHSLIPLLTERSQAGSKAKFRAGGAGADGDGEAYSPGRLERVALAATKQCLRTHAMVLQPPTPLKDLLPLAASSQLSVVGVEGAPPLRSVMDAWAASLNRDGGAPPQRADDGIAAQQRLLIVGPEGDFTPTELQQLVAAGARPVGLGSNRLRTETAAIALLAAAGLYNLTEP